MSWTRWRWVRLGFLAALCTACSDSDPDILSPASRIPYGLEAVTDLTSIAELRPPGLRVEQISSYDRTGGNADLGVGPDTVELLALLNIPPLELDNSYLYRDGDRYVIFDSVGPGVVYRIWMTGLDGLFAGGLGGDIAFELDDEPAPRLVLTRADLFRGAHAPFLGPLAGDNLVSSGGFYSVLPLPYARRLRITTSVVPNWVQVTHAQLPVGSEVESFDPAADTSAAAAVLAASGSDPKGIAPDLESEVEVALAPGEAATVWEHDGPGTITSFEVTGPPGVDIPVGLALEVTFDDADAPQVAAPLDDVFGASLGAAAKSLAFGRDGDRFYLYFPMPFRNGARVVLHNRDGEEVSGWRVRIAAIQRTLGARPGIFHAHARSARLEPDGRDYVLLDRTGTGHVVGVVMTAGCGRAGGCQLPQIANLDGSHLEGDERVSIDGARAPQIHGTGLEDFFSGGFYFVRGPFALPTHGNPAQAPTTSTRRPGINLRSMYRLLLGDSIPFQSSILLSTEHGPTNDVPAEISSVVFYYAAPDASLVRTDEIAVGSSVSESAHAFVVEGRIDRTLTSAPRGDDSDMPFTATGIEATVTRFRAAISRDNRGVRLRRLADLAAGRQSAQVRVDGELVGTWYSAEINPTLRWADLDFDVPRTFTRGRDSIEVEIDASGSPSPWTAYGYEISSFVE